MDVDFLCLTNSYKDGNVGGRRRYPIIDIFHRKVYDMRRYNDNIRRKS